MAPTSNDMAKDRREQKVDKRRKQERLRLIQEQENRIEQEKADYERKRDEEIKMILNLKAQVEAGASEVKTEYEKLQKEQNEKRDQTKDFENRLNEIEKERKSIEEMDWENDEAGIKKEPSDDQFSPPGDSETGGDMDSETSGDEEGGPLFTLKDLRKALGLEESGKVITWKEMGSSKVCITRFGPRNAPRFRIQQATEVLDPWSPNELPMFTHPSLRFGEMKDKNGKYIYPDRAPPGDKVIGIKAVAWYFDDGDEDPTKLLEPKLPPKRNKGDPRRNPLYPETQVMLEWIINGEKKHSWEVRQSVVRVYKTTALTIDQFIYIRAVEQEKRYLEWKNGQRKSEDRSPTPFAHILHPRAPQTNKVDMKPAAAPVDEKQKEKAARKAAMKKWAEIRDMDPDKLSDADEARFDLYWEARQAAEVVPAA